MIITFIVIAGLFILAVVIYVSKFRTGVYHGDISTVPKILQTYAKDISVFKKLPNKIYFPRSVEDVVSLVLRLKSQNKNSERQESLTVRAGGTCMSGGPLTESAVLDMTRHLTKVVINKEKQTAIVEAGAYFRDVEDAAAKAGLMFAPYPSSKRICGIGGMIGNNASGEKSVRFGATSDNILSMEVVLADGSKITAKPKSVSSITDGREKAIYELAKKHSGDLANAAGNIRKSASGYRLEKVLAGDVFNTVPLFCGAQGTLGIVTSAELKLVPIPKHLSLLVISAIRLEDIPIIVDEIFKWNPEAIETFDKNTFAKAREHLGEHTNRLLSYVKEDAELFILAEFSEAESDETERMALSCSKALAEKGYVVKKVDEKIDIESIWEVRRNSFLLMRDHNPAGYKAVPCIEDVIVPVAALSEFIAELHKILTRRGIDYGFHGHIGEGSLRIVPVFNVASPTLINDITGLMEEVFALIKRLHGNISADHSDGIIRSPFLRDFYGDELYEVFAKVKEIYDPQNIFNPGKKIGVSVDDINKYLDRA